MYKALERGTLDDEWMSRHLAQQVPEQGVQYYSLDGSAWPRPRARTMDDRQYVYHPTATVQGGSICIGYAYSLLDWVPEAHRSWSLCMRIKRIPSQMTAGEMGIAQVKELSQNRPALGSVLAIVAADGKYGNAKFLRPLKKQRCGIVVRLRKDRVLYHAAQQPKKRKRGHPRVHGKRFAFKEPVTWHAPAEVISFEHAKLGQVKLERWNNLHGKNDAAVPMDVLRASIHLERATSQANLASFATTSQPPQQLGCQCPDHLAGLCPSLAGRTRPPFPQTASRVDHTPIPAQRNW